MSVVKRSREELMSIEEVKKIVKNEKKSKSDRFVELYVLGLSVSEISVVMDCVYSFVWGRIEKVYGNEMRKKEGGNEDSWRNKFIEEWKNGKSVGEISSMFNKNYSYVWVCIDKYRKEEEKINK